ncbi:MAG: ACP S-malonyltransferase [Candidatus Marinimicrobia bacterium]|jgi:[acyl-carrier-protein] S-malonyltransferase|nr:ACP S-malonyltransferase [Candidatus Neomarinimicrobiota bacterium]MDP6789203.1 ACP S-malonyltransferase [Candidatus Neomarinimicrobiota bacterium]MDP7072604.1 ACP S-malonyltransferase [Candidatus Neomarinimicrobiota bacterium]
MSLALLYPGQGSQKIGMGLDLFENTDIGKKRFDQANEIMGTNISRLIFDGTEEELRQTQFTQPAIYIVSVILSELLAEKRLNASSAAGHSLGEYSAFTAAGAFDFETGLSLVKLRAESMQKTGNETEGTMAAVLGLDDVVVEEICTSVSTGTVVAANFNAPGQVVISGETNAVNTAMESAKESGASKVIPLNVSGAFHSPLMVPAREALAEKLRSTEIQDTQFPVYVNYSAKPINSADDIRDALIKQLDHPVRWHSSVTNMISDGADSFLEIGPGRVLQGLNRRIDRTSVSSGVSSFEDVNNYHV